MESLFRICATGNPLTQKNMHRLWILVDGIVCVGARSHAQTMGAKTYRLWSSVHVGAVIDVSSPESGQ